MKSQDLLIVNETTKQATKYKLSGQRINLQHDRPTNRQHLEAEIALVSPYNQRAGELC